MKAFDGKRNEAEMVEDKCDIGMVGLGGMGRNLLLNMADHGYSAAGYDTDPGKVDALLSEAQGQTLRGATELKPFIELLRSPKIVMMLVPAGPPVDSLIGSLLPHLSAGDVIIDGGNAARNRRIHVRSCLYRFNNSHFAAHVDILPDFRQLDIHEVTQ